MKFYKLERLKINPMYFNTIVKLNEWQVVKTDNSYLQNHPEIYLNNTKHCYLDDENEEQKPSMIISYYWVAYVCDLPFGRHYGRQYLVVSDEATTKVEKVHVTPYASTCKHKIEERLKKAYTSEEIEECLKSHSITQHEKPIHESLPFYYDNNTVHKFNNCEYYDINNAHLDALTDIFPKAKESLTGIRTEINKLKSIGDTEGARLLKDYVNIYAGSLGRKTYDSTGKVSGYNQYRGTYEWIVKRTRFKLQNGITYCNGEIIYANTDGFIVNNPNRKLDTSNNLGEFKCEKQVDTPVYSFRFCDDKNTSYCINQYIDSNGNTVIKGDCPTEMRQYIDLSKGQYVTFKKVKVNNHFEYKNIKIKKAGIKEW